MLDKDIKHIIIPFYVFQTIFFVRKYNITQDYLTTISKKDILLTFIVTLVNLIMFFHAIFPILNNNMIIIAILFYVKFALIVSNLVNIRIKNIMWSEKHLTLVMKLQNINRLLNNPNDKFVYLKNVIIFIMTVDLSIFSIYLWLYTVF